MYNIIHIYFKAILNFPFKKNKNKLYKCAKHMCISLNVLIINGTAHTLKQKYLKYYITL